MCGFLILIASCGNDAVEGDDSTTVIPPTSPTSSVSTTSSPTTSSTTLAGPAETLGADLPDDAMLALSGQLFEDPLSGSGFHRMSLQDERGVLVSGESIMGSGTDVDLLGVGLIQPEPVATGLGPNQILLESWVDSYTGDIVPTATVLYTLDPDGWVATAVIDSGSVEVALLQTTDYDAVAPSGPVQVDATISVFNWTARIFRAGVVVFDYFSDYELVYEGEIECTISDPLECTTLSDDGVLRPSDEGEDVEALQDDLAALGYFTGVANGKYEPGTAAAVSAFQTDYLLTVDGKAGPQTLGLMADIIAGVSDLSLASKSGIANINFGTAADPALDGLVNIFGSPDTTTGWYVDACDGNDWLKATWDGLTAIFTDRDGSRQFDGWAVDDLSDPPPGLLIAGGIRPSWTWSDFEAAGAEFDPTYSGFFRMTDLAYNNGRFVDPPTDPPASGAAVSGFGAGTGAFVSC
jgi:hypothetical protein